MTRRLTIWLALGCYGLVASGLPLPLGVVREGGRGERGRKDRSVPFPCMDSPCGCDTAEQCYTHCCCHTPTERLAWARARGLEGVVASLVGLRFDPPAAATGCCAAKVPSEAVRSCCDSISEAPPEEPVSCHARLGEQDRQDDRVSPDQFAPGDASESDDVEGGRFGTPRGGRPVTLRAMLACGGILSEWLAAGICLPPPPAPMVWRLAAGRESIEPADQSIPCRRPAPDVPPPRAV